MSSSTWTPPAVSSEARAWAARTWRMVEAQHVASTMKIVDDADEQLLLETLLDGSKPPIASATTGMHYLLASPFRYPPRQGGSRFRDANAPGVFYGAQYVRTACAELGYWRWKFLMDAVDLSRIEPVAHTAFSVDVSAQAVDLRAPPFDRDAAVWTHPAEYLPCQEFATVARSAEIGGIVYQSVRDPQKAWCVAVLTPEAFAKRKPNAERQTWWLAVAKDKVVWRRNEQSFVFGQGA